jgi:hypothetical protein
MRIDTSMFLGKKPLNHRLSQCSSLAKTKEELQQSKLKIQKLEQRNAELRGK